MDPNTSYQKRRQIAEKIEQNPGSYAPPVLLEAVPYFLQSKEYDRAAPLAVGAILRTEIDVWFTDDISLGDVSFIISHRLGEYVALCNLSEKEMKDWIAALNKAKKNFENWDRKTPRNYDLKWLGSHRTTKKKQNQIIEKFYRQLNGNIEESDYETASREDEFYFDRENRIFYGLELSFHIPEEIQPYFNLRNGKFSGAFSIPEEPNCTFFLNYGNSMIPYTFDELYNREKPRPGTKDTIETMTIIPGLPCFKVRSISGTGITNSFHFVKGHYSYNFDLTTPAEKEKEFVGHVVHMLKSIQFEE